VRDLLAAPQLRSPGSSSALVCLQEMHGSQSMGMGREAGLQRFLITCAWGAAWVPGCIANLACVKHRHHRTEVQNRDGPTSVLTCTRMTRIADGRCMAAPTLANTRSFCGQGDRECRALSVLPCSCIHTPLVATAPSPHRQLPHAAEHASGLFHPGRKTASTV
jgi:hypothetical protein